MDEQLRIEEIAGGSIQEQFQKAVGQVLENMKDINTSYKDKRKITIEMEFKQNEQRTDVKVGIKTTTKLAASVPVETSLSVAKDLKTGEIIAEEYGKQIRGQTKFDPETGEILEEKSAKGRFTPVAHAEDNKILKVN